MADAGGLNADFERRLNALIAASGGRVSLGSGYRSTQRQSALWNAALAKYGSAAAARKWVAPPGKSNHEKGEAGDLKFKDDAARQWAHANAKRFGLHFPMGHEPWHVERIGLRGAKQGHTPAPQSANAAEQHAADDGHNHGAEPMVDEGAMRRTVEYQMQSFAQLLMGGADAPITEGVESGV